MLPKNGYLDHKLQISTATRGSKSGMGPKNLNVRNLTSDPDIQSVWELCSQMTRNGYDSSHLPSQGKIGSSAAPTLTFMSHPRSLHLTRVITPQITQQLRTKRSWSRSLHGFLNCIYSLLSSAGEAKSASWKCAGKEEKLSMDRVVHS